MVSLHQGVVGVLSVILCIKLSVGEPNCPLGFTEATIYRGKICYKKKEEKESFEERFKDCAGNIFTSRLYSALNIKNEQDKIWTDYKSNLGGPFVDHSFTDSSGEALIDSPNYYDQRLGLGDSCIVIDPKKNFTATFCGELHYRYCVVEPYDDDYWDDDGCTKSSEFTNIVRFYAPKSTCLYATEGFAAKWEDAKNFCINSGTQLLSRGWRYVNNTYFPPSNRYPLGVLLNNDNNSIRYYDQENDSKIPRSELPDPTPELKENTSYGYLKDGLWYMHEGTYMFNNLICEKPVTVNSLNLDLYVNYKGRIILELNDTLNENQLIKCFSDANPVHPLEVTKRGNKGSKKYTLSPVNGKENGYYWCINTDSKNNTVSQSNRTLFISDFDKIKYTYAIRLKSDQYYNFNTEFKEFFYTYKWKKTLGEFLYYRIEYEKTFGKLTNDTDEIEKIINFKSTHPDKVYKGHHNVIETMEMKRVFLDKKTALIHVGLKEKIRPIGNVSWDGLRLQYIRPVYYCNDNNTDLKLGSSLTVGRSNYTCVGNFIEGVNWVISENKDFTTTPEPVSVSTNIQIRVNDNMPTPGTLPSETTTQDDDYTGEDDEDDEDDEEDEKDKPKPPPPPTSAPPPTTPDPTIVSTVTMPSETIATAEPTPPTTQAPEQQLEQVINDLETLIKNTTHPITVTDVEDSFDQVDNLLRAEENLEIPSQLLHVLDALGGRIDLNGSNHGTTIRNNIAMVVADASPEYPVRGLKIGTMETESFINYNFEVLNNAANDTLLAANMSEVVVQLPESVGYTSRRISFVVFNNDRAFKSNVYSVNSRVLSINVENLTKFDQGEVISIHMSPLRGTLGANETRTCAYWEFSADGTGNWSQDGCTFIPSEDDGMLDTCQCDHLTHFAEVLVPRTEFSEANETALEILSIIGCVISLLGLFMIGITAALFRSWRRDYNNKIWLHLCVAIFLFIICYLVVVFAKFETYNIPCLLVGIALHYSVLASFCWMLVAAVLSYRRLVIIFSREGSHKLLRAAAFAWGAPFAVVGILLSVNPHSYARQFEVKTLSGSFCYPSDLALWLTVYAPIAAMLLANWILFVLIVRSVFASRGIQRHGDANEALRCASVSCLLVFLFGLPWIFGLFAFNIVAAYFFTLTATLQGFVLFVFFVLGNKKTRDLWLNKLKIKQTRKVPVTSSTYTNRSNEHAFRPGLAASTIEANSQKPRSLTSPDNSRFS